MQRSCAVCAALFEAVKPQARYCGAACRKRAQRGGARASGVVVTLPVGDENYAVLHAAMMTLAEAMDDPATPPGVLPGLSRQLESVHTSVRRMSRRGDESGPPS